ncbi:decarboxylating NADP(+)-dependent phosphogluconate dehydrogenase [Akkermansiaceae bacterium]|nr:decarboxylating NADP(+)-dependent phosphogluconate dehydrogenase [Akkermansiaceae bacterium]MDB4288352.1 decarboxylating NADP(+)-dependent phosphogluconate dehydrogenase [bacterium]MDA7538152.1 decarboxylating NADP(+)-dependent phosphogluconate dehydrogenase [Akkermansiaceae bacterium]MDB4143243.1 decarboxylating NADP(+)-dependent phosphogluconate dehydrogenase [Akkermansiaceae bacterium]MDB4294877.1 decarboxylating NADP(+)-dependent phosphogluconate dehydrogenase [Akkermansiaceae bacterium]
MEKKSDFGLIGLAVMGQNLVLNVESRGFQVSVYNRTTSKMTDFIAENPGRNLVGEETLEGFVQSLAVPRKIQIMVQAGAPVDYVIKDLMPLLDQGDIIIDGGNSLYTDTERRDKYVGEAGFRFIGAGVSGGEEGALKGPSIMPGGPASTWEVMQPIFEAISAKVDGEPCVVHIGEGGAGHFVKMVHNGIEYGDMQLICEAYNIFKAAGFSNEEQAAIFADWNEGDLESFLIEITANILKQKDPETGTDIVDLIVDKAGQKGTGRWTVMGSVEQAVPFSTIAGSVEARILSSMRDQRKIASRILQGPSNWDFDLTMPKEDLVKKVRNALYASKIVSYAQGLDLITKVGNDKGWDLNLGEIAKIWRGGCIIRARFLNRITEAYTAATPPTNLMLADFFTKILNEGQQDWREVVALAATNGIPVPSFGGSLAYYDAYRAERLPANLLQAQRDFFGAHTYERTDKPEGEFFHTEDWPELMG